MTEKEKRLEEFEKKKNNVEWWTSGEYADDPNKKPSKQHLDQLERIKQRARAAGVNIA